MQDYYEITSEFRTKIISIMQNRYKELKEILKNVEIYELHRIIYEIESIKNKTLNDNEINKIIDKQIETINKKNKKETNDNSYS